MAGALSTGITPRKWEAIRFVDCRPCLAGAHSSRLVKRIFTDQRESGGCITLRKTEDARLTQKDTSHVLFN